MQEQLIIISSKDRTTGTTSNFTYNMGSYGPSSVYGYRINKISIPFSWYTIPFQTFVISYLETNYTIALFAGQYSASQLVVQLQELINFELGTGKLTVSYNSSFGTFMIKTVVLTDYFTLDFGTNNLPTNEKYKSVGISMGFTTLERLDELIFNGVSTAESIYAVNLTGPPNIYVKSSALQLYTSSFFNKNPNNVVQSVPVNVDPGSFIIWQNTYPIDFKQDSVKSNTNYDFQLVDEYDNNVDLRGLEWSIEIQFFYKF